MRDPDDLDDTAKRNLIVAIPSKLNKRVNKMIFKEILLSPIVQRLNITEDQVCPGGHPNSPSDGHFKIPQ